MRTLEKTDLVRARIPERFWNVKLKSIPDKMGYKPKLKTYLAKMDAFIGEGVGLFLFSKDNSSGKTSIGVLVLKQAIRTKHTAMFISSEEIKESIIEKADFDDEQTVIARANTVDVLVIDDIDKEFKGRSGFIENAVENLIRRRSQAKKLTVVTSNRSPAEICEIYTKDLAELMTECMIPLKIVGYSEGGINWRKLKAQEIKEMLE